MINYLKKNQLKFAPIYFLAPTIILFSLYVIYPIIDSIWVSFHSWNGMDRSLLDSSGELKNWKWVGLENYRELFFDDYTFPINIINNFKWLILSLLVIPIGLGLAIFLNQNIKEMKFIKLLLLLFLALHFHSEQLKYILFVVNSYLYYNNSVHNYVEPMLREHYGSEIETKLSAIGGSKLHHHNIDHLLNPKNLNLDQQIDLLIMQGGSTEVISAKDLNKFIHSA